MSKVIYRCPTTCWLELDRGGAAWLLTSRSALLAAAARRELARRDADEMTAAIEQRGGRCRLAGSFDSAASCGPTKTGVDEPASSDRHLDPDQVVHKAGESELFEARALRNAHVSGEVDAHVLDLALYEVGNVLARASEVAGCRGRRSARRSRRHRRAAIGDGAGAGSGTRPGWRRCTPCRSTTQLGGGCCRVGDLAGRWRPPVACRRPGAVGDGDEFEVGSRLSSAPRHEGPTGWSTPFVRERQLGRFRSGR